MRIEVNKVGNINNNDIIAYTLINSKGIEVRVLNYGGIITDIITPDKKGNFENIVLKYKDIKSYEKNPSYLGAIIGRTAGRIADGKVKLDNDEIEFNLNYYPNQGHGGNEGFDKKFFEIETNIDDKKALIKLKGISEDGEEYYPGNLKVEIIYELNDDNELIISYYGISDKKTLVNLTNHSYFNLSGNCKSDILDHSMYINSRKIYELNQNTVTTGKLIDVRNTEYDFLTMKKIGQDIGGEHIQLKYGNGYDIPWHLNKQCELALELYHEESGRSLEVFTDRKAIVVYTHNYEDNESLQNVIQGSNRFGVAIEPQNPPIGLNNCFIKDSILEANTDYFANTKYKFTIK